MDIKVILTEIEAKKNEIGLKRDKLVDIYDKLDNAIDSLNG